MPARKAPTIDLAAGKDDVVRTTTAEALLGVLSLGAMTGYELRKTIGESIGNFWSESFGQIYPALKRLVEDGSAEMVPEVHGGRGTGRKAYRLTAAGRRRLDAWLKTPSAQRVPRNEMLLKIFFAGRLGPDAAMAQVRSFREAQRARLAIYMSIRTLFKARYAQHPDAPYWRMTLEYGIAEAEALAGWCEQTLGELQQMKERRDAS